MFDRSFLPPALLEFAVISDTHHILDPEIYSTPGDSMTPALTGAWSARAARALELATELEPPLVVHLGDLTQEYPESSHFDQDARRRAASSRSPGCRSCSPRETWTSATSRIRRSSRAGSSRTCSSDGSATSARRSTALTAPAATSSSSTRRSWTATCPRRQSSGTGSRPSLRRTRAGDCSSSCTCRPSSSRRASLLWGATTSWASRAGAGCWHSFAGSAWRPSPATRTSASSIESTRLYGAPSTTTTRPGFYEAFSVLPADQGKSDVAKLGFFFVRVHEDRLSVHLIRTGGETESPDPPGARRIVACTPRDLRVSPLGVYLRHPLTHKSDGVVAYPNYTRHRIRDDYPLLACLELGVRHVRFPASDLEQPLQRDRLLALRDEGVGLTATALWPCHADVPPLPAGDADTYELQLVNRIEPDEGDVARIEDLRERGQTVTIAPLLLEDVGKVHRRPRVGFRPDELRDCAETLSRLGGHVDRAVCLVDGAAGSSWDGVMAFAAIPTGSVGALDFVLQLGGDEQHAVVEVAEALLAAATVAGCRLYVDPLQDLDRTADVVRPGLLDRLSNPRPAFDVARTLNTVVFGGAEAPDGYSPVNGGRAITSDRREIRLLTEPRDGGIVVEPLRGIAEGTAEGPIFLVLR